MEIVFVCYIFAAIYNHCELLVEPKQEQQITYTKKKGEEASGKDKKSNQISGKKHAVFGPYDVALPSMPMTLRIKIWEL